MLDNINPKIWGDAYWKCGYYVTYSYPVNPTYEDKQKIVNFFNGYQQVLPCEKCRFNFGDHLMKYPLDNNALTNKYTLMTWFLNINNEVNKATNKPIVTLNDVYDKYIVSDNNSTTNKQVITIILVFLIIFILIAYLVLKRIK